MCARTVGCPLIYNSPGSLVCNFKLSTCKLGTRFTIFLDDRDLSLTHVYEVKR